MNDTQCKCRPFNENMVNSSDCPVHGAAATMTVNIESLKQSSSPQAKALLKLIDTATRTAVTEALDKVADEVIGRNEEHFDVRRSPSGTRNSETRIKAIRNTLRANQRQRLEALRAVIAAGGKEK